MPSKSLLKLLVLAISLSVYVLVLNNIPNIRETQTINFGWMAFVAFAFVYIGLRWACGRVVRPLVGAYTNLKHPLVVGAASGLGVLLIIPAAALVALAIPGAAVIHPQIGLKVLLALSTYFFVVDGTWAYLDGDYKNNND